MAANPGAEAWIAAEARGEDLMVWRMKEGTAAASPELRPAPDGVHAALGTLCRANPGVPVVASGTALCPPAAVPANPAELPPGPAAAGLPGVILLPGLRQKAPLAQMQGGETRISGFLDLNPNWDGVVCLPGPATHWAQVSAGEAVSFQSFLTASLQTAMAPLLEAEGAEWHRGALTEAVQDAMAKPERLAAQLAKLQTAAALGTLSAEDRAGQLWGTLIGAELAAARPYWLGQNLALIAPAPLAGPYQAALEAQGLPVTVADPDRMALAGLTRAWRRLRPDSGAS